MCFGRGHFGVYSVSYIGTSNDLRLKYKNLEKTVDN